MNRKILIAYFSRNGHVEGIARELADMLGADLDPIVPKKGYTGKEGYNRAGKESSLWQRPQISFSKDPASYDLVIIGTPMWAFNMSSPVRSYLHMNKEKMWDAAFFSCAGSNFKFATWFMEREYGGKTVAAMQIQEKEIVSDIYSTKLQAFVKAIQEHV